MTISLISEKVKSQNMLYLKSKNVFDREKFVIQRKCW